MIAVQTIGDCTLICKDSQSEEVTSHVSDMLKEQKVSIITDPPYFDIETHGRQLGGVKPVYQELLKNEKNMTHGFNLDTVFKVLGKSLDIEYISIFTNYKGLYYILPYAVREDIFKEYTRCPLMVWNKTNPPPFTNGNFMSDNEQIFLTRKIGVRFNQNEHADKKTMVFVSSVLQSKIHTAQKPIEVMDRLVKVCSTKEHTVYDPYMGVATTAIACINHGRKFVGVEIDRDVYSLACERIQNAYEHKHEDIYAKDKEFVKWKKNQLLKTKFK